MGHKNFSQTRRTIISAFTQWALVLLILMYFASMAFSATAKEIDVSVDATNIKDPIVAFVFGQKGLMYNLTLEGSKLNKLHK